MVCEVCLKLFKENIIVEFVGCDMVLVVVFVVVFIEVCDLYGVFVVLLVDYIIYDFVLY